MAWAYVGEVRREALPGASLSKLPIRGHLAVDIFPFSAIIMLGSMDATKRMYTIEANSNGLE